MIPRASGSVSVAEHNRRAAQFSAGQCNAPSLQDLADTAYTDSLARYRQPNHHSSQLADTEREVRGLVNRCHPQLTEMEVQDAEAEVRSRIQDFFPQMRRCENLQLRESPAASHDDVYVHQLRESPDDAGRVPTQLPTRPSAQLPESMLDRHTLAPQSPSRLPPRAEEPNLCIARIIAQPPPGCGETRFHMEQPAYVAIESSSPANAQPFPHATRPFQGEFSAAPSNSLPMPQQCHAPDDRFVLDGNVLHRMPAAIDYKTPPDRAPRPDLNKATLRNVLEELRGQDNSCVFVCRKINKLGFKAKAALHEHYSQYGKVRQVLVPLSKAKTLSCHQGLVTKGTSWARTRPGNLGLVVMKSKEDVDRVISMGEMQTVKGLDINVQRFEHFHANKELENEEGNMNASLDDSPVGQMNDNAEASEIGHLLHTQQPTRAAHKTSGQAVAKKNIPFGESSVDSSASTSASDGGGWGYFSDAAPSSWSSDQPAPNRRAAAAQAMAYARAAQAAQHQQMQLKYAEAGLLQKMEEALRSMQKSGSASQGMPQYHGTGA